MDKILVLAGNPNVGKSVFFNSLTSSYVDVSNFPGTTVDVTNGNFEGIPVMDTPGVYGISEFNEEERVTKQAILNAGQILNVVDATRLERDLFLTLQLLELGKPMLIALNLMDDAERRGIQIDIDKLSRTLGVPVVPTSGRRGFGMEAVKSALRKGLPSPPGGAFQARDPASLRAEADRLANMVLRRPQQQYGTWKKQTVSERIGTALMNPFIGFPMLALMLFGIFLFIGNFLSQTVVGFTQEIVMGTWYYDLITGLLLHLVNPDSLLGCLLIGEYGILTMVPIYLFGLLLPLVVGFYFLMSILEDSGLLPRIAVLSDRMFNFLGLNGKSVIPILLGFGCVTMALITTRILGSKRERLIATALLCIAVPCSAQFAIILAVAASLELKYLLTYAVTIGLIFTIVGLLLNKILPGKSTDLFLTLPPLRLPSAENVAKKNARKAKHFLMDAGPMFVLGGILISLLNYTNGFALLRQFLAPLTEGLLGLPQETAALFVMSIIKRDLGAAGLYSMVQQNLFTQSQLTVTLTVITLFTPCFASVLILFKERGFWDAAIIWLGSFIAAFTAGAAVSLFLR